MAIFIKTVGFFLLATVMAKTQALPSVGLAFSYVSLDEATRQVRQDSSKKVLGAKTESIDGKDVHVIKVLTPDGRIQNLKIDAESGRLLGRGG
ncbi:MAG: PepSY domain-containing protein [Gammaproteobacteria bacterium]